MVSAHRCGAGTRLELENTRTALEEILQVDVDYVEFDVQRCADETFVLFHDDHMVLDGEKRLLAEMTWPEFQAVADHFLRYDDVLAALAAAGKKAHIDLKFVSSSHEVPGSTHEVSATRLAVEVLGAANVVVTAHDDASILAIRTWAEDQGIDLRVGLSLGRGFTGLGVVDAGRQLLAELFPGRRLERSRANVVVVHRHLARATVARKARRLGLPLLVWTVDSDRDLRYWLKPGRAWLVTTNHPQRALAIRRQVPGPR